MVPRLSSEFALPLPGPVLCLFHLKAVLVLKRTWITCAGSFFPCFWFQALICQQRILAYSASSQKQLSSAVGRLAQHHHQGLQASRLCKGPACFRPFLISFSSICLLAQHRQESPWKRFSAPEGPPPYFPFLPNNDRPYRSQIGQRSSI